jgi:hypothetical protein
MFNTIGWLILPGTRPGNPRKAHAMQTCRAIAVADLFSS